MRLATGTVLCGGAAFGGLHWWQLQAFDQMTDSRLERGMGLIAHELERRDGGHLHPTQTLTDLMTIRSEKGRLDNFTIGLCGDLKFGRTVHSLIEALVRYPNVKFVLISPEELRIPSYIREDVLLKNNIEFVEEERLEDAIPDLDILYMTRVQRERFPALMEIERVIDVYIIRNKLLEHSRPNLRILRPLPRVYEIAYDVDENPKAYYFQQAQNGLYARQAILCDVLGITLNDVIEDAKK